MFTTDNRRKHKERKFTELRRGEAELKGSPDLIPFLVVSENTAPLNQEFFKLKISAQHSDFIISIFIKVQESKSDLYVIN